MDCGYSLERISTIYVLSKNIESINFFLMEFSIFRAEKKKKKNGKTKQMARQDPRHRGSEEGSDGKYTCSFKASTAGMDRPSYKNARSFFFSMENYKRESVLKMARKKKTLRRHPQSL